MKMWILWLIVFGVFSVLEIMTEGFLVLWIGVAAIASMIYSIFFPAQFAVQVIIWVVLSIILIACTRKFSKKIEPPTTPLNVYSIIGKRAIVVQEINNLKSPGQIKIGGDVWTSYSENDSEIIPVDATVEVLRIDGVKAIVRKVSSDVPNSQEQKV